MVSVASVSNLDLSWSAGLIWLCTTLVPVYSDSQQLRYQFATSASCPSVSTHGLGQFCLDSRLLNIPIPTICYLKLRSVCLCVGGRGYLESFSTSCKTRMPYAWGLVIADQECLSELLVSLDLGSQWFLGLLEYNLSFHETIFLHINLFISDIIFETLSSEKKNRIRLFISSVDRYSGLGKPICFWNVRMLQGWGEQGHSLKPMKGRKLGC